MTIKLAHPFKIGQTLVPKDTEVKLADPRIVLKTWPGMTFVPDSDMVAIRILDLDCYLVLKKELEFS